jgi:accessory colonization factor AcfC
MKRYILGLILITLISKPGVAQTDTLHVYGPGGPFTAINECAKLFTTQTGIPVKVIAGPEPKWFEQARQNADIIYGGAEYMLTQFIQNHPDMVDATSRTELYKRAAAILVRPGNPKSILTLKDLTRPGIHILDVNGAGQLGLWEDIAGKDNLIGGIQKNIAGSFANTALGIEAWKKDNSYDAWITYKSWYYNLKDITQVIDLPVGLRIYRGTPIALTKNSKQTKQGRQFIQFLQSVQGHQVFKNWGWE